MTEKNMFLNAIVKSIRISGGRFLRRQTNDMEWEQVDLKGTNKKVRHAFRDVVMRRRKRPKRQKGGLSPVIRRCYDTAGHFDWKSIVMNAESADRKSPHHIIWEPTDLDILHGRDDFSIHHVGNTCFRTVIGYSLEYYVILSSRSEKSEILSAIVDTIHNSGGRFLRRRLHGGGWEQDDVHKAEETVGQALRDVIKKPEKILNRSSLVDVSDLFDYYKTARNFDWKGMVEIAHRLQSETNNSSARAYVDVNWKDDMSSISDSSRHCQLSIDEMSCAGDKRSMISFHEQQDIPSSVTLARL
jgi:hypothetical protein